MVAVDERTAEEFHFDVLTNEERLSVGRDARVPSGWQWQRDILDWWLENSRTIALKARQLGITWLGCAELVHSLLYARGSLNLVYRQKEEEAFENVVRCWDLMNSLPPWLLNGARVLYPSKGARPNGKIEVEFPDKKTSRIVAMTSASASGHGKTARRVLLDEFSRIDRAAEIMKAVQPAAGKAGAVRIISTANGVSNPETGEGNQFHFLWINSEEAGFSRRFLPWSLHPDRDQDWYDHAPEVRGLKPHERAEQYPANEAEAFSLTSQHFFDRDGLAFYGERNPDTLYRADFQPTGPRAARLDKHDAGRLRVFVEPVEDGKYAIGADVSTGRSADYSAAYVVDLSNMELCAEWHGKTGVDVFAQQLHYLGRWYNTALIAVESGGFGEAVLVALRDGVTGRPPYPNLYRHILSSRPDKPISKPFGFPMNTRTRPLVVNGLEAAIREHALPWMTVGLIEECQTFVHRETGTSPRALDGSRDDRVMAAGITLEMYRLKGHHPHRKKPTGRKPKKWRRRTPPASVTGDARFDRRYPA